MGQSERQTWLLQVCPVCGWTILDDSGVRNAQDINVGQDCEAWMLDGETPEHGPCRVVTVAEVEY